MKIRSLKAPFVSAIFASAIAMVLASCASSYEVQKRTTIVAPDYEFYRTYLDDFLARRCGTLDCHGQQGRAFRLYGFNGFRIPNLIDRDAGDAQAPILSSGLQPTTDRERRANFEGIIALEPEEMSRVIARNGQNPNSLLFLRKSLGTGSFSGERHKGGNVLSENDAGYRCIAAWLTLPGKNGPSDASAPKVQIDADILRFCLALSDYK
jgi:hypothetical protein